MEKNFILDTNVLLHDPRSLFTFEDNNVVIPIYVIEEVDKFKRDLSELGRNARLAARYLDALRAEGSLAEGVPLPGGGNLRVVVSHRPLPPSIGDAQLMDNRILSVALDIKEREPDLKAVFITKDTSLRIRADAVGLEAQDYDAQRVEISELYTGHRELLVPRELVDQMYKPGAEVALPEGEALAPNEFVLLKDETNPSHTAMGRMNPAKGRLVPLLRVVKDGVWGIRPRNMEQSYTFDLLLNDEIKLVTIVGKAGTGKTLLAIAAGLHKTTEESAYQKLLVSRPIFPLGRDIGYLPGDVEQKLNPWMQPIFDNLEFLFSTGSRKGPRAYAELLESGQIQVEPLTYIRGRSLPQQFIIVDEAQNLTPHEVKTIITRSGDGTKIVLTGDPGQIDNPYVDSASNGLSIAAERFRGEKLAAHIVLAKGERSELAELAANAL